MRFHPRDLGEGTSVGPWEPHNHLDLLSTRGEGLGGTPGTQPGSSPRPTCRRDQGKMHEWWRWEVPSPLCYKIGYNQEKTLGLFSWHPPGIASPPGLPRWHWWVEGRQPWGPQRQLGCCLLIPLCPHVCLHASPSFPTWVHGPEIPFCSLCLELLLAAPCGQDALLFFGSNLWELW